MQGLMVGVFSVLWHILLKMKIHSSCEIEHFVETHTYLTTTWYTPFHLYHPIQKQDSSERPPTSTRNLHRNVEGQASDHPICSYPRSHISGMGVFVDVTWETGNDMEPGPNICERVYWSSSPTHPITLTDFVHEKWKLASNQSSWVQHKNMSDAKESTSNHIPFSLRRAATSIVARVVRSFCFSVTFHTVNSSLKCEIFS